LGLLSQRKGEKPKLRKIFSDGEKSAKRKLESIESNKGKISEGSRDLFAGKQAEIFKGEFFIRI
jgi:hypothetical protein